MRWRVVAVLGSLFVGSMAALWLMPAPENGKFSMEIAKALLQVGVVAVAGAVVSLMVFEYQRGRHNTDKQDELDRKALEYRDQLLQSVLARTMARYSQAKKVRRLLRARAVLHRADGEALDCEQYDKLLELINESQLELENLARDVQNSAPAFTSAAEIVAHLRSMEKHLNALVDEYEACRKTVCDTTVPATDLLVLARFLRPGSEGGSFWPEFVVPFHAVQLAIRKDLLHPQLPVRDGLRPT